MAAREDQAEAVVLHIRLLRVGWWFRCLSGIGCWRREVLGLMLARPELVDRLVPGGDGEPGARFRRHAVAWPGSRGRDERVRYRILGCLQVPGPPRDRRDHGGPLLAVGALEGSRADPASGGHLMRAGYLRPACHAAPSRTGRTSTVPYRMTGIFAAQSSAVSRSGTSIR